MKSDKKDDYIYIISILYFLLTLVILAIKFGIITTRILAVIIPNFMIYFGTINSIY